MSQALAEDALRDAALQLPRLCAEHGTAGGTYKERVTDFHVEEVLAEEPDGRGEHVYVWIEKVGLNTEEVARRLARVSEIAPGDIGYAGLKDRQAVARQCFSMPARAAAQLATIECDELHVLRTALHTTKLRTGHLRGNRFRVLVRNVQDPAAQSAIVAQIHAQGLANFYGAQRFGEGGSTLAMGLALLRGESGSRRVSGRLLRLALSAVQSALFNAYATQRWRDGLLSRVILGDVVEVGRTETLAWSYDITTDQARYERHEVVPTGPIFGLKMRWAQRESLTREEQILARFGLSIRDLSAYAKLLHGTRRPLVVYPGDLRVEPTDEGSWLSFFLPSGSYATVLLGELGARELRQERRSSAERESSDMESVDTGSA